MAKVLKGKGLNHVQKGKGSLVLKQGIIGIAKIMEAHITRYIEEAEEKGQGNRE